MKQQITEYQKRATRTLGWFQETATPALAALAQRDTAGPSAAMEQVNAKQLELDRMPLASRYLKQTKDMRFQKQPDSAGARDSKMHAHAGAR